MDAVVTKFKKGLTQDTPKEPDNKKAICSKTRYATKSSTEGKKPSVPAQPGTEDKKKPSAPKPDMQPSPQPEGKRNQAYRHNLVLRIKTICSKTRYATKSSTRRQETKRTSTTWY